MKKRSWDEIRAKRLLDEGYTDSEIADAVGASTNAIKAWRYKNHYPGNLRPKKQAASAPTEEPAAAKTDALVVASTAVETDPAVETHADTGGKDHKPCTPLGPVEITFSVADCTVSLSAPDLSSAAWAAAYLNTVVGHLSL